MIQAQTEEPSSSVILEVRAHLVLWQIFLFPLESSPKSYPIHSFCSFKKPPNLKLMPPRYSIDFGTEKQSTQCPVYLWIYQYVETLFLVQFTSRLGTSVDPMQCVFVRHRTMEM